MRFKKEHQALNEYVFLEDFYKHFENNKDFIKKKDSQYTYNAYWHKSGWFYCRISDTIHDTERYAEMRIVLDYIYTDDQQRTTNVVEPIATILLFGKPSLPDVLVKKAKASIAEKYNKQSTASRLLEEYDDDYLPF